MCTFTCLLASDPVTIWVILKWILILWDSTSYLNVGSDYRIIVECVFSDLFLSGTVMSSPQIGGAGKNAAQCNQLQSADSWKGRAVDNFLPPWSSVFAAIKCKYISSRQVGQQPSQDAAKPHTTSLRWDQVKKNIPRVSSILKQKLRTNVMADGL